MLKNENCNLIIKAQTKFRTIFTTNKIKSKL